MGFKKGHRPHNKGHVHRDANFAKKPQFTKDDIKKAQWRNATKRGTHFLIDGKLPEQGTQYDDPKIRGKNSVWKSNIDTGF